MSSTTSNSNSDDKRTKSSKQKDTSTAEKEELLKEIHELKSLISKAEWQLSMRKFGNVTNITESNVPTNECTNEIEDLNITLPYQLYKLSGFQCIKFDKAEWIFEFTSMNESQAENTYSIQILRKNETASLGKWILPPSIDTDLLVSEILMNKIENVPVFLKSCKHEVDCFSIRCNQFIKLKTAVEKLKNCNVQTDLGCTLICIEWLGVYDKKCSNHINVTIQLIYKSNKVKPHKIEIDWDKEEELDNDVYKRLKLSTKHFKVLDLSEALEQMTSEDVNGFAWEKRNNEDDLTYSIDSDESDGSDDEFLSDTLNRSRKLSKRKRRSSSRLEQKEGKKKKNDDTSPKSVNEPRQNTLVEIPKNALPLQEKKPRKESVTKSPSTLKSKIKKKITLKARKNVEISVNTEAIPAKTQRNLKQLKLNFRGENVQPKSSIANIASPRKSTRSNALKKLMTSTPLTKATMERDIVTATSSFDISNITVSENS